MVQTRATTKRIESGQEQFLPSPSQTKKRRVDGENSPKKRRRGKPQGELCQLNLDVLFLLAGYVHPLDLLNLARTCRSLRELLMDKSSEFVWKMARRLVEGLPECPDDLTEPEYANLVFFARCHSCGKHAKKVLWALRRRYCPDCRSKRLCELYSCPDFIYRLIVPPQVSLAIADKQSVYVDSEQKDAFLKEYDDASDKKQFFTEKRIQYLKIHEHASKCREWENREASKHRHELNLRRYARHDGIFERLGQQGYEPELAYFGRYEIQRSHKPFFRSAKPLTDKEWDRMWPEWLVTMNDLRSQRLNNVVYRPRRILLAAAYQDYVNSPQSNAPAVEFLPDHVELRTFQGFKDILYAPEGTELGQKPFESVIAQVPALAEQWKKQVDDKFAEMIAIPSDFLHSQGKGSSNTSKSSIEKLRLACAVFSRGDDMAFYPDILFFPSPYASSLPDASQEAIHVRLQVRFFEEAPYVIHACGLDPSVATAEDMDRRNARLKCLTCSGPWVMDWRNAMRHAFFCCTRRHMLPRQLPQFELVSHEHMDSIQAAEALLKNEPLTLFRRCLLCPCYVGNAMDRHDMERHLLQLHAIEKEAIQQDVHHTPVGIQCGRWWTPDQIKMVEKGGQVTFV